MRVTRTAIHLLLILGLAGGAVPAQDGQPPVSFVNTIAVGDSVAAGFQSGVVRSEGQIASFPALIARQAGTYLFLPLFPAPGVGQEIRLVDGVPVPGPVTGSAASRGFPLIVPQHIAITGQGVFEALTVRPDFASSDSALVFPNLVLGVPLTALFGVPPVSQIELAVGLQPTFTIFWLGLNDVLGAALAGDPSLATPIEAFQATYPMAVGALLAFTSTRMVVANIPDVTVIPFLTPAEEVAAAAGAPLEVIGPVLGIGPGDLVTAPGIPLVSAILTGQMAPPLPSNVVLTAAEVGQLRVLVAQMNGFISALAAQLNIPVVDANGVLNDFDQNGVQVGGRLLTTDFLGGLFTLDGVHPTNTAHALTANAFIQRINEFYGLSIPLVDVAAVAAQDPLVPPASVAEPFPRLIMPMGSEGYQGFMKTLGFPLRSREGVGRVDSGEDPLPDATAGVLELGWEEFLEQFRIQLVRPGPVTPPESWRKEQPESGVRDRK